MSDLITIDAEALKAAIRSTVKEAVEDSLAEHGIGSNVHSGRVYRTQMIETIGRTQFDEAVRNGRLRVQKHNPDFKNSKVYATREDWDGFLELRNFK